MRDESNVHLENDRKQESKWECKVCRIDDDKTIASAYPTPSWIVQNAYFPLLEVKHSIEHVDNLLFAAVVPLHVAQVAALLYVKCKPNNPYLSLCGLLLKCIIHRVPFCCLSPVWEEFSSVFNAHGAHGLQLHPLQLSK